MQEFELICLANSRKRSGRCVAGIRSDGSGWVRLVSWAEEGELKPHHYALNDGTEARVLDLFRVRCLRPRPEPHHPENWLVGQGWQLVARPAPEEALARLRQYCTPGPALLGNMEDSLPFAEFARTPARESLALIEPQSLRWLVMTNPQGMKRIRVLFSFGGVAYSLSLTDPVYEPPLLVLPLGTHTREKAGLAASDRVLLTISLSEPFQSQANAEKRCYKLVAAIVKVA